MTTTSGQKSLAPRWFSGGADQTAASAVAGQLRRSWLGLAFLFYVGGAFIAPPTAFSIDDVLYIDMARAMAERGSFAIAGNGDVDGAAALTKHLTYPIDGAAYPQYPGGYAFIAGPFYAAFGVYGLILMNALSAVLGLFLTAKIGARLYQDKDIGFLAAMILGVASFFSSYAFSVWPHLTALALTLAGVERLTAGAGSARHSAPFALLTAGLYFGLAVNIRVDATFLAAAGYFWLRLFAAPSKRGASLVYLIGLAPGLFLAAYINHLKFGILSPITYGPKEGADSIGGYLPYILIAASAGIGAFAIDVSRLQFQKALQFLQTRMGVTLLSVVLFTVVIASPTLRHLLKGVYVLVVDLQQLEETYFQPGVARLENNAISFWGLPKKALLQSIPFAVLILISIFDFLRGEKRRAHALSLGMIMAPIIFYSLNQWHGGYAYSMRYFLPCLPFIAILCSAAVLKILRQSPARTPMITSGAGLGALFFGGLLVIAPASNIAAALYPQLILAAGLTAAVIAFQHRPTDLRHCGLTFCASAAIAASAVIGFSDLIGYDQKRRLKLPYEIAHAAAFDPDVLVLTTAEDVFTYANARGVHVMRLQENASGAVKQTAEAFIKAQRCVYLHTLKQKVALRPYGAEAWIKQSIPGVPAEFGAVYLPASLTDQCTLTR